jgi:hypothetical protein
MKQAKHAKKDQRESKPVQPEASAQESAAKGKPERDESTDDLANIMYETAHIPDRDQMMGIDKKILTTAVPVEDNSWTEDPANEEIVTGEDTAALDAVKALQAASRLHMPQPPLKYSETPTPAARAGAADDATRWSDLSDEEIKAMAEAFAIAGRSEMNRHQLVTALRSVEGPA